MTKSKTVTCKNCNCLVNKLGQYPQTRAMVSYMTEGYKVHLVEELLTTDLLPEETRNEIIQKIHQYQELAFE